MPGTIPCPGTKEKACGYPIPAVPGATVCVKCGGIVIVEPARD